MENKTQSKQLDDPLDIIAESVKGANDSDSLHLFEANPDNITLKTDLTHQELVLCNNLTILNEIQKSKFAVFGIEFDMYGSFLDSFKRHKVSLDRKSRAEFTQSITPGAIDKDIERVANIKTLTESRQ